MIMQDISRRRVLLTGLSAVLAGCSHGRPVMDTGTPNQIPAPEFDLKPLDLSTANLSRITVCLRPFRPAGPRLEMEAINGKGILHNYGHGGSGWSLAWGYAEAARDMALAHQPRSIAILGAGAIGLTTAIAMAETGTDVTIFARDMPLESASSKATGVWSPSSRIGFAGVVGPGFADMWEALARRSYARHLTYADREGSPVEMTPRFYIRSDLPEPSLATLPEDGDNFLHLNARLRDRVPAWSAKEGTPFPNRRGVRGGPVMTFNIAGYTQMMMDDFEALGGQIEKAEIRSLDDLSKLPGDLVLNCSGYGAKSLARDHSLIPVRGQIAWMPAQTDRLYGIYHRNVSVISRRDGLLIQETGGNDYYGFGSDYESPRHEEFLTAQAKVAPMFEWV